MSWCDLGKNLALTRVLRSRSLFTVEATGLADPVGRSPSDAEGTSAEGRIGVANTRLCIAVAPGRDQVRVLLLGKPDELAHEDRFAAARLT